MLFQPIDFNVLFIIFTLYLVKGNCIGKTKWLVTDASVFLGSVNWSAALNIRKDCSPSPFLFFIGVRGEPGNEAIFELQQH